MLGSVPAASAAIIMPTMAGLPAGLGAAARSVEWIFCASNLPFVAAAPKKQKQLARVGYFHIAFNLPWMSKKN